MTIHTLSAALAATAAALAASAAVAGIPVNWTADTFKVRPLAYECYHGETLDMSAELTAYGEPLALGGKTAVMYWQTNGMGSAWWSVPASATNSTLSAVWSGAYDTGAKTVTGFIGVAGENYRAAFTLTFRDSPGFVPNQLPPPRDIIDCERVTFVHPEAAPFGGGGGTDTNAVREIAAGVSAASITNAVTGGYLATEAAARAMAEAAETAATHTASTNAAALYLPMNFSYKPHVHQSIGWNEVLGLSVDAPITGHRMLQVLGYDIESFGGNVVASNGDVIQRRVIGGMVVEEQKLSEKLNANGYADADALLAQAEHAMGGKIDDASEYTLTNVISTIKSGYIASGSTSVADTEVTLDFSSSADKSGDCMLMLFSSVDGAISPKPMAWNFIGFDDDYANYSAGKTNVFMFTRMAADTVLITRREVK